MSAGMEKNELPLKKNTLNKTFDMCCMGFFSTHGFQHKLIKETLKLKDSMDIKFKQKITRVPLKNRNNIVDSITILVLKKRDIFLLVFFGEFLSLADCSMQNADTLVLSITHGSNIYHIQMSFP